MAKARWLSRKITESKKLQQLSRDDRFIYVCILPYLDWKGRGSAEPNYLKQHVFQELEYTTEEIADALEKFTEVGLIAIDKSGDIPLLTYLDFEEHSAPIKKPAGSHDG